MDGKIPKTIEHRVDMAARENFQPIQPRGERSPPWLRLVRSAGCSAVLPLLAGDMLLLLPGGDGGCAIIYLLCYQVQH